MFFFQIMYIVVFYWDNGIQLWMPAFAGMTVTLWNNRNTNMQTTSPNTTHKIVCLLGPTAAGKTQLSFNLVDTFVDTFPMEIVSVDSALIYRDMTIGTAKPDAATLKKYPHFLIDTHDAAQAYSAADFCRDATHYITEITDRNHTPLFVGGTMLYFRSLWQGLSPLPPADASIRTQIDTRAAQIGWHALHDELQKTDPIAAARIHPNDPQRIQRALEVYYITGKSLSDWFATAKETLPEYNFLKIAIAPASREVLHQRIAQRFDQMLQAGLIEEVRALHARGDLSLQLPSMRAVGYRQVWEYLEGNVDYATMREKAIVATRQLAKRQLTWLRSFDDVVWLDSEAGDVREQVVARVSEFLA